MGASTPPNSLPKTPLRRPGSQAVQGTPISARLSSTLPHTSTALLKDLVFVHAATEMKGKFLGPIPLRDFMDAYMAVKTPPLPTYVPSAFQKVADMKKEPDMYDPLIEALNPFCNGLELYNTSAKEDPQSGVFLKRQVKPDISGYKKGVIAPGDQDITRVRDMITFIEVKNRIVDEPFSNKTGEPFECDTACGRDTRGQLTLYANAIQATQFRTHVLSVFINQSMCRFIHWSRSCAVVTEAFDYTKHDWLPRFFWCLSHADDDMRGIDTTFEPLTDISESRDACDLLELNSDDSLYRVSVCNDVSDTTSYYIVSQPFTKNHIHPIGRGTRCFIAIDCESRKKVLLKDSWRVKGYMKEGVVYRELMNNKVKNIANLLASGDVLGAHHTCGEIKGIPNPLCRVHYHYRIVLDTVGCPITRFRSTWEMVRAVCDAMEAHQDAVKTTGILHRDISVGNILIVRDGGILIDWELCKRLQDNHEPRALERTGTWQFISIRLLMREQNLHDVGDDLESFLYVLAWVAARYAPNEMSDVKRTSFMNSYDYNPASDPGYMKRAVLVAGALTISEIKINQPRFKQLLSDLWKAFACRYRDQSEFDCGMHTQGLISRKQLLDRLETHDWMIDQLHEALKDDTWRTAQDPFVHHTIHNWSDDLLTAGQLKRKTDMLWQYPELDRKSDGEANDNKPQLEVKRQKLATIKGV